MTMHVSGRMRVLFDRQEIEVPGEDGEEPVLVPSFRCRWCGFTVVTDTPDDIPDHTCSGPAAETTARDFPPPPMTHSPQ